VLKGRIARVIAATRFPFVGQDDWDESRTTVVNDYRNKEWAFDTPDGPLYPSVAVLNADGTIRECGEVEVKSEFTEEDVTKWRTMSERLLDEGGIQYAGLRAWSIDNWNLVLKPYKTPDMAKDHR